MADLSKSIERIKRSDEAMTRLMKKSKNLLNSSKKKSSKNSKPPALVPKDNTSFEPVLVLQPRHIDEPKDFSLLNPELYGY
jgi:hypothetical protein